jgi:hypothetical protein
MTSPTDLVLEQPAFFAGQRLLAADLSAVVAHDRSLRELHARALHDWGVAFGLAVAGAKGERSVRIAAGYALDRDGHELIVPGEIVEPVPPVAAAATYLVVLVAGDGVERERREGVCAPSGAVRIARDPVVLWRRPAELAAGDVVLATALVQNCRLCADVSPDGRRNAGAGPRPRIAAGRTEPGATTWHYWPDPDDPAGAMGVAHEVETANGGFRETPGYHAHAVGPAVLGDVAVTGHAAVHAAAPDGFVLRLLMPRNLNAGGRAVNPAAAFDAFLPGRMQAAGWHVVWMGTEP